MKKGRQAPPLTVLPNALKTFGVRNFRCIRHVRNHNLSQLCRPCLHMMRYSICRRAEGHTRKLDSYKSLYRLP